MTHSIPKILLLGDYSNFHATLAQGLSALGCEVHLASDGCGWMQCRRDTDISRKNGKLGGFLHLINMNRLVAGDLAGFDIVAVHDPMFTRLRPNHLHRLFKKIKANNGKIFLSAISTDIAYLQMLESPDSPLKYSEWFVNGEPSRYFKSHRNEWKSWHAPELVSYQNYFFDNIDGAVSGLYEYHLGMLRRLGADNCAYGGIPIDTDRFHVATQEKEPDGGVRIFLGRDKYRKEMKGSDYLEYAALKAIEGNHNGSRMTLVENLPFNEFISTIDESDIVLDQIYSYTPATTALMAMAKGKCVVSGGEPDFYDFIGEINNRPIVNAPLDKDELTSTLVRLIENPDQLRKNGLKSREFVIKHNSTKVVAQRFLKFWLSKC